MTFKDGKQYSAWNKLKEEGLTFEQAEKIKYIEKGKKPAPETYLSNEYIQNHLQSFKDSGAVKIMPNEPSGTIGGKGGTFVMSGDELDEIIHYANGDISKIEDVLGLDSGYLGENPVIVMMDDASNVRMPSGNELGAWPEYWEPGIVMEQEFYFIDTKDGFAKAIQEEMARERRICEECGGIRVTHLENTCVSFRGSRKGNYYTIPTHFMIDSKLKGVLEKEQITGYELKDINIVGSYGFRDDGILEMVITGRAGHLQKLTGEEFEACSTCGRIRENIDELEGVGFDVNKWDGSDIFLIDNFRGIPVVTQKVKDLLEKNKIKNIVFTNIKEFV